MGDVPQDKYESLLEMRTDENNEYVEKEEVKEIVEELVIQRDNRKWIKNYLEFFLIFPINS